MNRLSWKCLLIGANHGASFVDRGSPGRRRLVGLRWLWLGLWLRWLLLILLLAVLLFELLLTLLRFRLLGWRPGLVGVRCSAAVAGMVWLGLRLWLRLRLRLGLLFDDLGGCCGVRRPRRPR